MSKPRVVASQRFRSVGIEAGSVLQERASGVKANKGVWLQAAQVQPADTTLLPTVSHVYGFNGQVQEQQLHARIR